MTGLFLHLFTAVTCLRLLTGGLTVIPLNQIPPADWPAIKKAVIESAQAMYEEGRRTGHDTIFPIPDVMFDIIDGNDAQTGFSRVAVDSGGNLAAFALAYFARDSVHIEKIGTVPGLRRQGVMRSLLRQIALRAQELKIRFVDLLVVKTNKDAQAAYERVGFRNITPPSVVDDPRYNAYAYAISVENLLRNTTP